ncbi:MAG: ATP:cob(I)alamin adenosyltransferase [Actinomycetia bacterium]|nr:ATP:cob(I)alamin adenosyltransferase [Actinomycetes bacterium]
MAKTYTRTGDDGSTSHPLSGRTSKNDPVVEVLGLFDEAQVAIGYALSLSNEPVFAQLKSSLIHSIDVLFLCADASPSAVLITDEVSSLERAIDELQEVLAPLSSFIRPTGCDLTCRLHAARVAVRRLERGLWRAIERDDWASSDAAPYLNRLSDYLFVAARWVDEIDHG